MSLLRGLSRLLAQPVLTCGQLSASTIGGLRPGFAASGAHPQQQCSSLLGFLQSRLLSTARSEGLKLLSSQGSQQLAAPSACGPAAAAAWQQCSSRGFASKLTPRFTGGKLKPYSSYKERFKMTGSGKIRYMRPGAVHKHFNKGNRQNRDLSKSQVLHETYAKTMRKLGFKMRHF